LLDLFKKEEINSLKKRIKQLEEEKSQLMLRFEKKDELAKKTVSTKQEVDRELNDARHRISSLENEIQKLKKDEKSELSFRLSLNLGRNQLDELLFKLGSMRSKLSTLITFYLTNDETLKNVNEDLAALFEGQALHLIDKIESSTGKVVFYDTDQIIRLVLIPVFPIIENESSIDRKFNLGSLANSLSCEKTLVINAHAGESFIGMIEADSFVEHEIIRSSVMGKHSKGGWSQKRFQSLVEEDIKHHVNKVRDTLIPIIEKNKDIQYVIASGEVRLVKTILEGYEFPVIPKSLDSLNPQQVIKEVMSVRLYGI